VFGADPLTPKPQKGAGDYVFLLEDNLNDGHAGGANPIAGHQAGHNVLSDTKGIGVDPANPTSPGGSFPADQLACSSCHDPHGTTSFRLLYGANRLVKGEGGFSYAFTAPAPVALGIDLSGPPESNTNHTAYRTGVSAWCGNCHGDFHGGAARVALLHPSDDPLRAAAAGAYNAYRGTTNCIQFPGTAPGPCGNGTALTSYLALVPIQDANTWNTTTSTRGGTATSRVMCLTCHRAHASSAPNAGRWDFDVTFLADDGAESGSHALPNPYDANQRSLCNKCHQKDRYDALPNP
jgi:hypothetical protein